MPTRAKNLKAVATNWLYMFEQELKKIEKLRKTHKKELEELAKQHDFEIDIAQSKLVEIYEYLKMNTKEVFKSEIKAKRPKLCKTKKSKVTK